MVNFRRMIRKFLCLSSLLFAFSACVSPVAYAQDDGDAAIEKNSKKSKKKKKQKIDKAEADAPAEESKVGAILKKNTFFNQTSPNLNADFFIFLKSASWCKPCNDEMPEVVEAYKQMKESGRVELILTSWDQTAEAATKYLEKFNAPFAGVMKDAILPEMPPSRTIPHATFLKSDGTVVTSGHGSIIRDWKKHTIGEFAIIGDDGEPRVGKALKKVKFINGKPSPKADFYVYYFEPQMNDANFSTLAEKCKTLKKNKFELIYISGEPQPAAVLKALKKNKVKAATVLTKNNDYSNLPGMGTLGSSAKAFIVTQSGAQVTSGGFDIIDKWQEIKDANPR